MLIGGLLILRKLPLRNGGAVPGSVPGPCLPANEAAGVPLLLPGTPKDELGAPGRTAVRGEGVGEGLGAAFFRTAAASIGPGRFTARGCGAVGAAALVARSASASADSASSFTVRHASVHLSCASRTSARMRLTSTCELSFVFARQRS